MGRKSRAKRERRESGQIAQSGEARRPRRITAPGTVANKEFPDSFFYDNANDFPEIGPAGISYFPGQLNPSLASQAVLKGSQKPVVDCLVWRDESGIVRGWLSHWPFDIPPIQKKGDALVVVDPARRRRGIGLSLLTEGISRFNIDLARQKFSPSGAALVAAYKSTTQDPAGSAASP